MGQQEKTEAHPLTIPIRVPPPCVDPGLLAQIVKAVMEGMASSTTQEVPATQILQVALEVSWPQAAWYYSYGWLKVWEK